MLKHLGMQTVRAPYVWPNPSSNPKFHIRSQISLVLIISNNIMDHHAKTLAPGKWEIMLYVLHRHHHRLLPRGCSSVEL